MSALRFVLEKELRETVRVQLEQQRSKIKRWLPEAEIEHIGSTAIPGALTKGDVDVVVRVSATGFREADAILARHYRRNLASVRDDLFASFTEDTLELPFGIQLTVRNGPHDCFGRFRDALIADTSLLEQYNQLKSACAGLSGEEYRAKKSAFIEKVLAGSAAPPA